MGEGNFRSSRIIFRFVHTTTTGRRSKERKGDARLRYLCSASEEKEAIRCISENCVTFFLQRKWGSTKNDLVDLREKNAGLARRKKKRERKGGYPRGEGNLALVGAKIGSLVG